MQTGRKYLPHVPDLKNKKQGGVGGWGEKAHNCN